METRGHHSVTCPPVRGDLQPDWTPQSAAGTAHTLPAGVECGQETTLLLKHTLFRNSVIILLYINYSNKNNNNNNKIK